MHTSKPRQLALAIALATPAMALPIAAHADSTGNIGVVSSYVLRGLQTENHGAALQGGYDYSHDSGLYLGWWGSSLDYKANSADPAGTRGFEHDFYGGFAGSAGSLSYKVGVIQYYYVNVDDSNLTEALLNVGFGPVSAQVQYLLTDGAWGNAGDAYWTLNYGASLPADFRFAGSLGWYTYEDDDNDELACGPGCTQTSSDFRHLNLTLTHPVGNTGADMSLTYVFAGKDRTDTDYDDSVVFGISYAFDI
jgi:uncharacterized protein (TIGR02001 family)